MSADYAGSPAEAEFLRDCHGPSGMRGLLRLALPLSLTFAGHALLNAVDTAVVGRLGPDPLAAIGLAHAIFFGFSIFGLGVMTSLDAAISQAIGGGRRPMARALLGEGNRLALGLSLALMMVLVLVGARLDAFLGASAHVAGDARLCLWIRAISLAPLLRSVGYMAYLQATGRAGAMAFALTVTNVINLVANVILVLGSDGLPFGLGRHISLPSLGAPGSAIATVIAVWVQYFILARATKAADEELPPEPADPRDLAVASPLSSRKLFVLGIPIGLQMSAEMGIFALAGVLAGRFGSVPMGAHQITLQLASLTFTTALGVAKAGSVAVGYAVGGRQLALARKMGLLTFLVCGLLMTCTGIAFASFPHTLARIFSSSEAVIAQAIPLLALAALFQVADGLQCAGAAALRGAGDMRFPFLINLVGYYATGLPVALYLAYVQNQGVVGLWRGLCLGLWVVAIVMMLRFLYVSSRPIEPIVPGIPNAPNTSDAPRQAEAV